VVVRVSTWSTWPSRLGMTALIGLVRSMAPPALMKLGFITLG
jgi:hypothetical protein